MSYLGVKCHAGKVVKEVNAKALGRNLSVPLVEWYLNQLVFADAAALLAHSEEKSRQLVEECGRVCERTFNNE